MLLKCFSLFPSSSHEPHANLVTSILFLRQCMTKLSKWKSCPHASKVSSWILLQRFQNKSSADTDSDVSCCRSIHFIAGPQPDTNTPKCSGGRFRDLTGSEPQSVQAWAERAAEERHVINGSYQAAVALGSWLCFPPITLTGRKMGRGGNGWNSEGQTLIFTCLPTDKETGRRHGEGLPDTVWVRMRSEY